MEEQLPWRAEYAKSGRSSCKICKIQIQQDSLRMARMVQAPTFDGKIPHWHHSPCFFKKYRPASTAEIHRFDALRWDDQEKIKEILGEGDDATDGPNESGVENPEYSVEYSKSSRATCRTCDESIEKGVVRVSKLGEMDKERQGVALVPRWHHLDCFVESRMELGAGELSPEQIPGFKKLKADDQKEMNTKFGTTNKKGKKKVKTEKGIKKEEKLNAEKEKEKELLRKQNKEFWRVRDALFRSFENKTIREILDENDVDNMGGETAILDKCVDGILFGKLDPCPECGESKLVYSAEKGYICKGNITAWTNCTYRSFNPKRSPWVIPEELKEEELFKKMKLKVQERKFPASIISKAQSASAMKEEEDNSKAPLENKTVVLIGLMKESHASLKTKVEALGGNVSDTANYHCFCCISSPGEVLKGSGKMVKAESCNIPVVAEEYLDAIKNGGAKTMLTQYAIAPWGGPGSEKEGGGKKRKHPEAGTEESAPKKAKMVMKGGSIVDPESGKQDCCHLLTMNGDPMNVVLGLVNLQQGTNSYYKLQILKHDIKKSKYYVYRSWGRVGTTIGDDKLESYSSREDAIDNFLDVYLDKTGNNWGNRKNFVKRPNKFYPIDIDYGQDDEVVKKSAVVPGSISKLANPIKELMKFIFDIQAMKDALVEFEIDLKKMPLGKLSRKQIDMAYSCLSEALTYQKDGIRGGKVIDVSTRFYTMIPHDFGLNSPPLLDNSELINLKIKMLDSLLEIEIAYNLTKQASENEDPVDVHYKSLNTEVGVLEKDSEDFKMISDYVSNTHAKTHMHYSLEVEEVFDIQRKGEKQRYRPFRDLHNRKLLWHGSRSTNFAGILSQGLRIAPPEAPVTGYMFGKGVYFADMASKSANYCNTTRSNSTGLMLLCEVALGNMYELTAAEHITKLPAGKHSCKGLGKTGPDPVMEKTLSDGVVVPMGAGTETPDVDSTLLYNEYIIYDTAQCNMKYLVKLKFNYK